MSDMKEDNFVLPEKCAIFYSKNKSNFDFNIIRKYEPFYEMNGSGGYYSYDGNCNFTIKDNTEITFAQFQKYVLNQVSIVEKVQNYKYLIKILKRHGIH